MNGLFPRPIGRLAHKVIVATHKTNVETVFESKYSIYFTNYFIVDNGILYYHHLTEKVLLKKVLPVLVLALLSVTVFTVNAQFTSTSSSWSYSKEYVIVGSPSGDLTNYQTKTIIHFGSGIDAGEHVYCDSNCREDFGDIRFKDANGDLIDYWIEEKTDFDIATIWVEVPLIPAYPSITNIVILYGNPSASTTSNGEATFPIFDDFDDDVFNIVLWEDISQAQGVVTESGGVLELSSPPGDDTQAQICSVSSYTGELAVHAKWRTRTSPNHGGAGIIRVTDDIDPDMNDEGFECWWGGISWALDNFTFLERGYQRNVLDITPLLDNWYNIELRILAEYAEMVIDDAIQASLQSTQDYTDTETLEIGLRVNSWVDASQPRETEYDWVFLRKLCDPEPLCGISHENVIRLLEELRDEVDALSGSDFTHKNPNAGEEQRKVLLKKIDAVLKQVTNEAYQGALNKLERDVRDKVEKWIEDEFREMLSSKIDTIMLFLASLSL